LASRAAAQQRTTNEITAAGLGIKIEERLDAEADLSRNPDLESMYHWLAANRANSIYLDAFDERNNRAMSDIIINFNTNGVVRQTLRIPNTYGFKTDVNLTRTSDILPGLAAALEAVSATQ
jgi:phospholipase/lecithinase/hemolysin